MRLASCLLTLVLVVVVACKEGDKGGGGGSGGAEGGAAGAAGGGAGAGGGGTGGQNTVLTGCPPARPMPAAACSGNFTCNYDVMCICGVCCVYGYQCQSGAIAFLGFSDACMQVNPQSCRDGGTDGSTDLVSDGAGN